MTFGYIVFGIFILACILFYSGSGIGVLIGVAIVMDLGLLGIIMNGNWVLIVVIGIPTIIFNYLTFSSLADKKEKK